VTWYIIGPITVLFIYLDPHYQEDPGNAFPAIVKLALGGAVFTSPVESIIVGL
jgi:hypothetical protein